MEKARVKLMTETEAYGHQGRRYWVSTQFLKNLRSKNRLGTTEWEKSTKLQSSVVLLVKNLLFAHQVFTRLHRPWSCKLYN